MSERPGLSIVVPMYNEGPGVEHFFATMTPILESLDLTWEIVCVNDGSRDNTLELLTSFHSRDPRVVVADLSRNFGKEAALTAGLDLARGQCVIPIDADLQDDPTLIPEMVAKWREGYEVVLAKRVSRDEDSFFKRLSAGGFYKIINAVSRVNIPENAGDFRLMDRMVVDAVRRLDEKNRFMKGLFAWAGFKTCTLGFERKARLSGESKWNYRKLWSFALDGIFSFSNLPLKIWTYLGILISTLSFLYGGFLLLRTLFLGRDVPGYASIMVCLLFLGGVQLISLGVIGEYVARIYDETKRRPIYFLRRTWGLDGDQDQARRGDPRP